MWEGKRAGYKVYVDGKKYPQYRNAWYGTSKDKAIIRALRDAEENYKPKFI